MRHYLIEKLKPSFLKKILDLQAVSYGIIQMFWLQECITQKVKQNDFEYYGENEMTLETITFNKLAYSIEEISAQTSLSKAFLRLEIKRGNLKAVRPGNSRRVIITAKSLEDYLNGGEKDDEK